MSVYIVTAREHGVCKIGYSNDPVLRFQNLQIGSFADLTLEAIVPGDIKNESQLHLKFGEHFVRGEWFKITPDIESIILSHPCKYKPKPKGRPSSNDWSEPAELTFGASLFRDIRDFCILHDISSSAFGKLAVGDWKIVTQIKGGRDLRLSTVHKIKEFMATYSADLAE